MATSPCLSRNMLAFDIETTGLDPAFSVVTVVCTEDFRTGERHAYEFGRIRANEPQNEARLKEDLIAAFNAAESLCAFNGIRFDIPFLHTALKLPEATSAAWLFKTTDILEACRLGLFGPTHTFSLNLLCQHNQIQVKSGSGLQAIKFAQERRWNELLLYCADDVRILCDLYRRRVLNNPRFCEVIDLARIAPTSTYPPDIIYKEDTANTASSDTASMDTNIDVADLKARLFFYNEYVLDSPETGDALERLRAEITDLKKKLAVYHEFCVCFE